MCVEEVLRRYEEEEEEVVRMKMMLEELNSKLNDEPQLQQVLTHKQVKHHICELTHKKGFSIYLSVCVCVYRLLQRHALSRVPRTPLIPPTD